MAAITRRYARALADTVFDRKIDAPKAAAQLRSLVTLLEESQPLREVWENPAVSAEQKLAVLDAIAKRMAAEPVVRNFMAVVIDHRRVPQLEEIAGQFEAELNQRLGMADAEITTARDLDAGERREIEGKIAAVTGKTVKASYSTDGAVLGGAIIRVGSTIYDGSVRGQLQKLKQQLISNGAGAN